MKFIDYLRSNPICFDSSTDTIDFDASSYIEGTTTFDVSEVADQLIDGVMERPQGMEYCFTSKGIELIKPCQLPGEQSGYWTVDFDQYVGIVPPFDSCFFEYPAKHFTYQSNTDWRILDVGIHLASMSQDWIAVKHPDFEARGIKFAMFATVFLHSLVQGQHIAGRETVAYITSDSNGRITTYNIERLLPVGADRSLPKNQPDQGEIAVMLVALMMLNSRMLKSTLTEPPPKSRQQRRYEERHPNRATPPPVSYYTLEIDLDKTGTTTPGAGKKGGWKQAWHEVRGFLRHYKSGKVVPVRQHSRGNPLKGIILKDYKLNQGNAA